MSVPAGWGDILDPGEITLWQGRPDGAALELVDGAPGSANFAQQTKRRKNRSYQVRVGSERIPDGSKVSRMMRDIQIAGRNNTETGAP